MTLNQKALNILVLYRVALVSILLTQATYGLEPKRVIECALALREHSVSAYVISESTENHPNLAQYLREMNDDPLTPLAVRRILHEAMVKQRTNIRELTAEIRKVRALPTWAVGEYNYNAVAETLMDTSCRAGQSFILFDNGPELNGVGSRDPLVWVENSHRGGSPQEMLVHELAHIRFMGFLDRNLQAIGLSGRLPAWVLLKQKGQYSLRTDFYHYLAERYAYEIQFQFVRASMQSQFSGKTPHSIFGDLGYPDEVGIRMKIIELLRHRYSETNNPSFRQFDSVPISSILLGK